MNSEKLKTMLVWITREIMSIISDDVPDDGYLSIVAWKRGHIYIDINHGCVEQPPVLKHVERYDA